MADLEIHLRKKQVERLPISKGDILLSDLALRYPNLLDDIQQEHEARRFTAAPGTSLPSSSRSLPSKPMEWKHPKLSSGKKSKKSATPVQSPIIQPAGSDLIFDMDDDLDMHGSPVVKTARPSGKGDTTKNLWRDGSGRPLKEQPLNFAVGRRFRVLPENISATEDQEQWSVVKTPGKGYLVHLFV